MADRKLNERVAIAEVVIDNVRYAPGAIVELTKDRLERLAKAGCVHADEEKDMEARIAFEEAAAKAKPAKEAEKPAGDDKDAKKTAGGDKGGEK